MEKRYYSQYLYSLITIALVTAIIAVLSFTIRHQRTPTVEDLGMIALIVLAICMLLVAFAVWFFPVIISPTGIRTYTFWGTYDSASWDDIQDVRGVNFGMRFVTFVNTRGARLYIPVFLHHYDHFCDDVHQWAGEQHPLTLALKDVLI